MEPRDRLCFALDVPDLIRAEEAVQQTKESVGLYKVGLELFTSFGPKAVHAVRYAGGEVFLDLKLHDIPATVERAVARMANLEVGYLTVHASGGPAMIEAASRRAEDVGMKVLAVTVLTSLDKKDLGDIGFQGDPEMQTVRLARVARDAGAHGLVCSVSSLSSLRQLVGDSMTLVTPGIRPSGTDVGDQKRTGTPAGAIGAGSDILVVGRPIRDAGDRTAAAAAILEEISGSASPSDEGANG